MENKWLKPQIIIATFWFAHCFYPLQSATAVLLFWDISLFRKHFSIYFDLIFPKSYGINIARQVWGYYNKLEMSHWGWSCTRLLQEYPEWHSHLSAVLMSSFLSCWLQTNTVEGSSYTKHRTLLAFWQEKHASSRLQKHQQQTGTYVWPIVWHTF